MQCESRSLVITCRTTKENKFEQVYFHSSIMTATTGEILKLFRDYVDKKVFAFSFPQMFERKRFEFQIINTMRILSLLHDSSRDIPLRKPLCSMHGLLLLVLRSLFCSTKHDKLTARFPPSSRVAEFIVSNYSLRMFSL